MKRLLVTGASGVLGGTLIHQVLNDESLGLDLIATDQISLNCNRGKPFEFFQGDINYLPKYEGVTHIVHFAAISDYSVSDEALYQEVNVESTKRLRELYPESLLILASSIALYPNTVSAPCLEDHPLGDVRSLGLYPFSKHQAEPFADVALRQGTVVGCSPFGKRRTAVEAMFWDGLKKGVIKVSASPTEKRAFIGIDNLIYFILNLISGRIPVAINGQPEIINLVECHTDFFTLGERIVSVLEDKGFSVQLEREIIDRNRSQLVSDRKLNKLLGQYGLDDFIDRDLDAILRMAYSRIMRYC